GPRLRKMRMQTPRAALERAPGLHRHIAVRLGRECQDGLRRPRAGVEPWLAARAALGHAAIESGEEVCVLGCLPRNALGADTDALHQRPECHVPVVDSAVIALHHCYRRRGLAWHEVALPALPVERLERLSELARRVVQQWCQHHVLAHAEVLAAEIGEGAGEGL